MGMTWTTEQRKVIDLRDRNILVSAAAGSGKTAVLVERILSMVTDSHKPLDVDRLLIVTFTRAAAGEPLSSGWPRSRITSISRGSPLWFTVRRSVPLTDSAAM